MIARRVGVSLGDRHAGERARACRARRRGRRRRSARRRSAAASARVMCRAGCHARRPGTLASTVSGCAHLPQPCHARASSRVGIRPYGTFRRYRRPPQRGQEHGLQRPHRRQGGGGQLSVLHDRSRTSASCRCPMPRLERIQKHIKTQKVIPAIVEIVDIAGLVKGASQGEGLGNKFLANIRETNAILMMVRCFDDPNVIHVAGLGRSDARHRHHRARARARRRRDRREAAQEGAGRAPRPATRKARPSSRSSRRSIAHLAGRQAGAHARRCPTTSASWSRRWAC